MNLKNIWKSYPELLLKPYLQALPTKTLARLGLQTPAHAIAQGYVCVRPDGVRATRSTPGLWLHSADRPLLETFLKEIETARVASKARSTAEAAEQAARDLAERHATALSRLAAVTGLSFAQVQARLPPELLAACAVRPERAERALVLARAPTWRGAAVNQSTLAFTAQGHSIAGATGALCKALLEEDVAAYVAHLEGQLATKEVELAALCAKWEASRPTWYSPQTLVAWAAGALKGRHAEHPLLHSTEVPALAVGPVQLQFQHATTTGRVNTRKLLARLWQAPTLNEGGLATHLPALLKELLEEDVQATLTRFLSDNPVTAEVRANEFSSQEWREYLTEAFVQALPAQFDPERAALAAQAQVSKQLAHRHLELTARRCRSELPSCLKDYYPLARSMARKITFIYGPTNSGKTHQALEHLKAAKTGAYLGPLRLLALEVFDRLNAANVPTSLVTGELIQEVAQSRHTSATVEMLDLKTALDVAIVDEVQMLADPDRGSAWLQAVLGAPAKHLVLLGSASALPAVRMLARVTGERLSEVRVERLSPLEVCKAPHTLRSVPSGSALIVFSRQAALSLASFMRSRYGRKVSVVYGALSPEVRSEQARQFREGETDVLVSTDAIGMGLNLPIHTVVFTTVTKWNGTQEVDLEPSLTFQIAGRAGRFGLQEGGFVSATTHSALKYVKKTLTQPLADLAPPYSAGLNLEMAESISRHLGTDSLSQIIAFFVASMTVESWALPRCSEEQHLLAGYLDKFALSLQHKLLLSNAPAVDKGVQDPNFKAMVECIETGISEELPLLETHVAGMRLEALEARVKSVTVYSWMHYRFPELFPRIDSAQALLAELNAAITKALSAAPSRACKECGTPLPWDYPFGTCESCFKSQRRNKRPAPRQSRHPR